MWTVTFQIEIIKWSSLYSFSLNVSVWVVAVRILMEKIQFDRFLLCSCSFRHPSSIRNVQKILSNETVTSDFPWLQVYT